MIKSIRTYLLLVQSIVKSSAWYYFRHGKNAIFAIFQLSLLSCETQCFPTVASVPETFNQSNCSVWSFSNNFEQRMKRRVIIIINSVIICRAAEPKLFNIHYYYCNWICYSCSSSVLSSKLQACSVSCGSAVLGKILINFHQKWYYDSWRRYHWLDRINAPEQNISIQKNLRLFPHKNKNPQLKTKNQNWSCSCWLCRSDFWPLKN